VVDRGLVARAGLCASSPPTCRARTARRRATTRRGSNEATQLGQLGVEVGGGVRGVSSIGWAVRAVSTVSTVSAVSAVWTVWTGGPRRTSAVRIAGGDLGQRCLEDTQLGAPGDDAVDPQLP